MDEWRTNHNELDRAHAQINKLQQKNSVNLYLFIYLFINNYLLQSLHERVVELERTTPSPPLISITHTSSPRPNISLSPPAAITSPYHPSPPPTSPPLVMVSDTPLSPFSQASHNQPHGIPPLSYQGITNKCSTCSFTSSLFRR